MKQIGHPNKAEVFSQRVFQVTDVIVSPRYNNRCESIPQVQQKQMYPMRCLILSAPSVRLPELPLCLPFFPSGS